MEEEDPDLETGLKVVAIMQTIAEDLDESGKRAWRKMLGISPEDTSSQEKRTNTESESHNADKK